jgi:hypothetical protein
VPTRFFELLDSGTASQTAAVMATMETMVKLELGPLEAAFAEMHRRRLAGLVPAAFNVAQLVTERPC